MAENNGKSMETPALKATIPEKLGKCFLYFPSHCNVFVHFRGHHCKGTPPEKMRNCRRAKGSGRAVVTGLSTVTVTVTVTQTASLKSHACSKGKRHSSLHTQGAQKIIHDCSIFGKSFARVVNRIFWNSWLEGIVKGTLMTGKAQTARTLLNGLCSFQIQNVGQALACSTGA